MARRYCSAKKGKGKGKKGKFGWDYSGASHIAELHALLRATVMVSNIIAIANDDGPRESASSYGTPSAKQFICGSVGVNLGPIVGT